MELQHTNVSSEGSSSETMDSDVDLKQLTKSRKVKSKVTKQSDCHVKRASALEVVATGSQAQADMAVGEKQASDALQVLILKELQWVNSRLDQVEYKVDKRHQHGST